jgi:hypothetical protein
MLKPSPVQNRLSAREPSTGAAFHVPGATRPVTLDTTRTLPVAQLRDFVSSRRRDGMSQEVFVTLAQAPLGCRVFIQSEPISGPSERIAAIEMPFQSARGCREYRALLPPHAPGFQGAYVPVAVVDGKELRGDRFHARQTRSDASASPPLSRPQAVSTPEQRPGSGYEYLPSPAMELIAHVEADLPSVTVFGPTPEGLRISYYIANGRWTGPRIHARYRAEGGDWIVLRRDGVAVPNARATVEADDGALLYYELTGTIDLGPEGYARGLANDLPEVAALSLVARVTTASEKWQWLNRLTLVGAGVVNLKIGRTDYDLYSIQRDPAALQR